MDLDDLFTKKKPAGIVLGEDLSRLSVAELEMRLQALAEEKVRIETEITAKQSLKAKAESIFRGG